MLLTKKPRQQTTYMWQSVLAFHIFFCKCNLYLRGSLILYHTTFPSILSGENGNLDGGNDKVDRIRERNKGHPRLSWHCNSGPFAVTLYSATPLLFLPSFAKGDFSHEICLLRQRLPVCTTSPPCSCICSAC